VVSCEVTVPSGAVLVVAPVEAIERWETLPSGPVTLPRSTRTPASVAMRHCDEPRAEGCLAVSAPAQREAGGGT
jgi:hypothetical protein